MRERLKQHYTTVAQVTDRYWGLRRGLVAMYVLPFLLVTLASALVGAEQAYAVSSEADVIPSEVWIKVTSQENLADLPPAARAIGVVLMGTFLGVADGAGRIVFHYFMWVPQPVWRALATVLPLAIAIAACLNAAYVIVGFYNRTFGSGGEPA